MYPDHLCHLILQCEGAVPVGKEVEVDGAGVVPTLTLPWVFKTVKFSGVSFSGWCADVIQTHL